MAQPAPTEFFTYGHVLHALEDAAMTLVRQVADDENVMRNDGLRTFVVLSAIVRRSISVSMHLEKIGVIDAVPPVPKRSIMSTLDVAIKAFADHKVDAETHRQWMDADIDADEDDISDIPGRHPASLIIELCRDLGITAHTLPKEWLDALSPEIRLLLARAAAAGIRPSAKSSPISGRADRLMHR